MTDENKGGSMQEAHWLEEAINDPLQMSMFEGEKAKDEAVSKLDMAYDGWIDSVMEIIFSIPRGQTFTTDYLWEQVETTPNEPRAMGAVMTRARKEGSVSSTGKYIKSRRPECHARPVMIWRRV
tara:strand:- start:1169 stop:1540 length:372 start_codon:yes stop_codon:yes gene_type:complete